MNNNILLAYGNKAPGATLSGGSWDSPLVLNNLKTGKLGQVARSTSASVYNTQFRFDLAANYVLRALALINHNLTTRALWRKRTTDAAMDMDLTGPTSMKPVTLTTSGGANGTRVGIYGTVEAATCPRYDFSPVNLASGTASQTLSDVQPGVYACLCLGSGAAVMATGPGLDKPVVVFVQNVVNYVEVKTAGDVTLTVLSATTSIHFRGSLGVRVEPESTNLLARSNELDDAAWTKAPANTQVIAGRLESSNAASAVVHQCYQLGNSITAGSVYSAQAKAKASEVEWFVLNLFDGAEYRAYFDLQSGAVGTVPSGFAAEIKPDADGYWLCTLSGPLANATVNGGLSVEITTGDGLAVSTIAVGDGAFVKHTQFELGPPTTYIPTTSAAVTRTADSVSITGSNFSGFYNQSEGTFYVDAVQRSVASGAYPGVLTAYGGGDQFIALGQRSDSTWWAQTYNTSSLYAFDPVAGTGSKAALAYKSADHAATSGGATPSVSAATSAMPAVSSLRIGQDYSTNRFSGHIRRIAYWPTRRTNAELQTITTTGPDALGLDTGWQNALQMTFHGDTPANWGEQYPLIAAFDSRTARYGTVEIDDTANPASYVQVGQLFIAGGFQPSNNAEYSGFSDGMQDLSSSVKSVGGQKYSTDRARRRTVDFSLPALSQAEGDHLHELKIEVGTTGDVLYVADPGDPAHSQRYSFLGTLRELTPLEYPYYNTRATPMRMEQKL